MKPLFFSILLLILMGCQQQETPPSAAWSKNNLGVGQMGSFNYDLAYETFEELHNSYPDEKLFHHNFIIAIINRQKADDEATAIKELNEILTSKKGDATTHYLLGLLYFNNGDCESSIEQFKSVIDIDPTDAYALYFLGQCRLQDGQVKSAYTQFTHAIKVDPYLRSAYYGAFITSQRLNQTESAQKHLHDYQKLEMNPQSKLAEIKYTKMGPKAMALVNTPLNLKDDNNQLEMLKEPFADRTLFTKEFEAKNFTLVSLGTTEVWVAANDRIEVFHKTATGLKSAYKITAPGILKEDLISIIDVNQDGLLDGYVTSENAPDRIFLNTENNHWKLIDKPLSSGTLPQSKRVQVVDFDHDGDLDILSINHSGSVKVISNNNNLSFRILSKELITDEKNNSFINTALLDVDGDRDLDILLLKNNELIILLNDRMWSYQQKSHTLSEEARQIAVNYNKEGVPLIHISSNNGINTGSYDYLSDTFKWDKTTFENEFNAFHLTDVNGDGIDDYILHSPSQSVIRSSNDNALLQTLNHSSNQSNFHVIAGLKGPELLTTNMSHFSHWPASDQRHQFLMLHLSGKELEADSMRSNALGLGTEVTVHNNQFSKKQLYLNQSYQPNQPYIASNIAALIPKDKSTPVDFISLLWSDGVYQTELSVETSKTLKITETQRQLSSCPVLFMSMNDEFEFLTDVMGVGAMGFLVGKDQYAQPRDWEFLLLDQADVDQSDFTFLVTEPMEETMFLDAIAMKVYEADDDLFAVLDERLSINSSQPSGDLMFYTEQLLPKQIISQDGSDQTSANMAVDAVPLAVGELDLRFLGHLKEPQIHTMYYDQPLQGEFILMVNGWVEYGYSQTSFNAWQAGQSLQYPSLDAEIDGQWVTLLDNWGFPAGMPKMAAIEFAIPAGKNVKKLRFRSTQEVYIDQVSIAQRTYPEISVKTLPLINAKQSVIGFPDRQNGPNRYPIYDFSRRQPFADTRHMTGAYTQLGPVEPLVEEKDNALAIVSGGEAVTFQFKKPDNNPPKGKQRFYVMEFYGWAKDMDMLTENDKYLQPLPQSGPISEAADKLNQKYNTRFMSGN